MRWRALGSLVVAILMLLAPVGVVPPSGAQLDLAGAALRLEDLVDDYTVTEGTAQDPRFLSLASYSVTFTRETGAAIFRPGPTFVANLLVAADGPFPPESILTLAAAATGSLPAGLEVRPFDGPTVGSAPQWRQATGSLGGIPMEFYVVAFSVSDVGVSVISGGFAGRNGHDDAAAFARIVAGRLLALR